MTRQSIYKSQGVFGKTNLRLPLEEINEVKIWQGPLDFLFGIGTISLKIKIGKVERLVGIKDPEVVERKIKALLSWIVRLKKFRLIQQP